MSKRRKTKPPKDIGDVLRASQHLLRTFEKTQMTLIHQAERVDPNADTSVFRFTLSMLRENLADIDAALESHPATEKGAG